MCSRTLSDPANRLRKTRKKKSSAVPYFRSGRRSLIFARLSNKGKVGVQRGRETAGVPSFLPTAVGTASSPPRGAARSRRPQTANPPAEVQRKTLRPERANTLTQFACPGQLVQKRRRPSGANTPAAVRVPRSAGTEKGAAPLGRTRLRQFEHPAQPVQRTGAAPSGRTRLRQFAHPAQPVLHREKTDF